MDLGNTVLLNVKLGSIMAATTAKFTSCAMIYLFIAIIFIIGFEIALAQDHRFRINVYDDYPQQQQSRYQNYQVDRYEDRYQEHYQEPYQEQYRERYEAVYEKPIEPKKKPKKKEQDFSKIPGVPGVDFPIYHSVPHTSFSCSKVPYLPGMYANIETGCQAYHTCHDGREGDQGASFLCSNGTLFNQNEFACDWWYNVNCNDAIKLYKLNGDATTNPFVPKAKKDQILRDRLKIVVF